MGNNQQAMKTVAKTEVESNTATELSPIVGDASTLQGDVSEVPSGTIRYMDDKTFQHGMEKVFRVHEPLLAKLAE